MFEACIGIEPAALAGRCPYTSEPAVLGREPETGPVPGIETTVFPAEARRREWAMFNEPAVDGLELPLPLILGRTLMALVGVKPAYGTE